MKKIIGFDLDDTLAVSKSAISPRMADLLGRLLKNYQVCVISGGKFEQFQKQVIDKMSVSPELLARFHMMPTCGTRYYTFNVDANEWQTHYKEDFTDEQKQKITQVLEESARKFDLWEENPDGEIIDVFGARPASLAREKIRLGGNQQSCPQANARRCCRQIAGI